MELIFTRLIADVSLFVVDIPVDKAVFSLESFFSANGVDEAIPFITVFEFVVVVVVVDDGKEVVVDKDFLDGSWLCERLVRDVDDDDDGDVGDKFVNDSLVDDGGIFSKRDIRPREPSVTLFDVDC